MKKERTTDDILYICGLILFGMALIVIPLYYAGIFIPGEIFPPCPFHAVTGLSCPGCGSTRAVTALLNGHIIESIKYNPSIIYFVILYIPYMFTQTVARLGNLISEKFSGKKITFKAMKFKTIYLYIWLIFIIIFFVIRLFFEIFA